LRVSVPTSTERPRGLLGGKGVEKRDGVLARSQPLDAARCEALAATL
jgi:hypothetical protein